MAEQQLIREIILHMKDTSEIKHFCKNAKNARELCKTDPIIRDHIKKMAIETPRITSENKDKIKTTYDSSKMFPIEIRRKIIEQVVSPEQLAMECYKDPNFSDICKDYRESLCRDVLISSNFKKDLSKWANRYCYLLEELLKIVAIINRNKIFLIRDRIVPPTKLSDLISVVTSFQFSMSLTEEDFNQIPNDIVNFIQKNKGGLSENPFPKPELYEAVQLGDIDQVKDILKKFFVPIEIKNDLLKIAVRKFIVAESTPQTDIYSIGKHTVYTNIISNLLLAGANDVFYILREAVRTSNIHLLGEYSGKTPPFYLIYYTLKECILTQKEDVIAFLTDLIDDNKYPKNAIGTLKIPNIKRKINLPKLIALIYYHKFNYLLPYFTRLATPNEISKAEMLYETPSFEDTYN